MTTRPTIPSKRPLWTLLTVLLLAWNSQGFCTRTYTTVSSNCRGRASPNTPFSLQESNKNDNDNTTINNKEEEDDNSYSWAELQADEKLRQLEFNSSIKRKNAMLLPQRISKAIYTLGWSFVISGILLNSLGYAWVQKPEGGLGIGTLDQRNFQREMYKRSDDDASKNVSRTNNAVKEWVSSTEEAQQNK